MNRFLVFIIFLAVLFGCKKSSDVAVDSKKTDTFQYISEIRLDENQDSLKIISDGNIVSFSKKELPLKSVMVVPTSVIAYLDELDLAGKIIGISQPDFIFNSKIKEEFKTNKIIEIGSYNEIFIEKILVNKPDIFISTTSPTLAKYHELLRKNGVKVLLVDEYLEPEPLARAEYVKIFGKLFGKEREAGELFQKIESDYINIRKKVNVGDLQKPSVLVNQMYGDVWYMPGGNSFQAKLIADSGGNYLWSGDTSTGSLNLSFETVFERAGNADVWVNAGDYPNLKSLLSSYKNYEWFESVKNKRVYNWNLRITAKGANDYFETGTARPDLVLQDLATIFHPELFPNHELFFYKNLK